MNAKDVYNIATALSNEELFKLCDMLELKMQPKTPAKRKKKPMPDFTVEDGIAYLINNHFNKVRKP
ncbi:hypothetical protein HNV08_05590 [Winogradskyella eckloniae]|uniref:hypothetical protein n=1 Tax=Winogradskyella eckloniae TaxID=1089306 RepID=UPI001567737C|nr:hypothetical protein [Winogradskyella eckloniae]NRD19511.1 hypothetical protein [Winogradskyella eckloniae]